MNKIVTLATVQQEYDEAKAYGENLGWKFSEIDNELQVFTVLLVSPVDQEEYLLEILFDDYPEKPLLLDFIFIPTKEKGKPVCYPKGIDSFFQPTGSICHPCSRKAYVGYANLHADWNMAGWQSIAGGMTSIRFIIDGIFTRISNKSTYDGRMVPQAV
jgi:hypothetical protein